MGWSVGFDEHWQRDIGYGVPAVCDHPKCNARIDRGLSFVCCDEEPYGGDGCGLYFCLDHQDYRGRCSRCRNRHQPFQPKADVDEWVRHKLSDESWQRWRDENPDETRGLKARLPAAGRVSEPDASRDALPAPENKTS